MAWILSTFNLLLFLSGCAHQTPTPGPKPSVPQRMVKVRQPASPILPGPTRPSDKFFADVTRSMGLEDIAATKLYAIDFNNDGHTDLVTLPEHYSQAEFHQFVPAQKVWEKIPSPIGGHDVVRASFLAFADFDKDGINDAIMATFNQKTELTPNPLRLFRGYLRQGPYRLEEVPDAFPKHIDPVSSLALLDYDLDGHLDVYVGNWYDKSRSPPRPAPDRLYKGKVFTFEERSHLLEGELTYDRSLQQYTNARPTFGVSICDINQDGYADIPHRQFQRLWQPPVDISRKRQGIQRRRSLLRLRIRQEGEFLPEGRRQQHLQQMCRLQQ